MDASEYEQQQRQRLDVFSDLKDILKATQGMPLPERFQAISDRFNCHAQAMWLFGVFGYFAAEAGELRRERNEARARLAEWEAMTPNRLPIIQ